MNAWLARLFVVLALSPVVSWYVRRLNDGSDEPLGLGLLALAAGLAWRDREFLQATSRSRMIGAAIILASSVAILWLPPMLRAAMALVGVAFFFGIHQRAGMVALLVLSLPVVASLQFYIGYPMRLGVAEGAVRLLELGNVVVSRSGVQIEVGGQVIGVDPACSGVKMLWHALAAAMGLAAYHRLSWQRTCWLGMLAVGLVIPANIGRAAVLVIEETGHWKSGMLHGAVGLAGFAAVLFLLWQVAAKSPKVAGPTFQSVESNTLVRAVLMLAALVAPIVSLIALRTPVQTEIGPAPVVFTFDGVTLPLQVLPQTPTELAFAKSFPGSISSHRWGEDQVIFRRVTEATRRLHPSRDCLRAGGFETGEAVTVVRPDGTVWSRLVARRDGERLIVYERIVSERNNSTWTDASAWYWSALWHPLNGPWQAVTVISR